MIKDDDNFDPFEFFDEEEAEAIDQKEKKKAQDEAPVGGSQVGEIKDPSVTVEEVSREDANFENDEKEQALAAKERHVLEQEAAAKVAADQAAAEQAAAKKRAEEQLASEKAAIAEVAVEKAAAEQAVTDVKEQLAAQQKALEQMAAQQVAKQKALDEMAIHQAVKQRELDDALRKKGSPPTPGNSDLPQSPSSRSTSQGSGGPATPPPLPRQSNEELSEGNSEANDTKPGRFDNEPSPAKINRNLFNK
jgi:membrane protein involved in colicin uptake